ncbi:MAG: preprotein translocase subunit YajC [Nitrospinota bacterium]
MNPVYALKASSTPGVGDSEYLPLTKTVYLINNTICQFFERDMFCGTEMSRFFIFGEKMVTEAFAQTTQGGGQGGALLANFIPIIAMFAIFYFILIRPQKKKQTEHQKMLDELKDGDNIVTSGGLYGTITKLKDDILTVQVAENVRVKIARSSVTSLKKN